MHVSGKDNLFQRRSGHGACRAAAPATESGFTFLEIVLALAATTIIALGLAMVFASNQHLVTDQELRTAAQGAAEARLHAIINTEFEDVLDEYGPDTDGEWFDVEGLEPLGDDEAVGRVVFFTDETVDEGDALALGFPRDLNSDGDAEDTEVTSDANLLPVQVQVRWQSASGDTQVVLRQILFDRPN